MKNSPRKPNESLFSRGGLTCTCFYGILIAVISLGAFLMLPCALLEEEVGKVTLQGLKNVLQDPGVLSRAQTYSFTVLGMSQLFHAIGMRDVQKSVFR